MRKVLLVSYTFPPQYDVSARRAAKLCTYLPAAGWQPVVLTKDWALSIAPEDRSTYTIVSHPDARGALGGVPVIHAPYRSHDNALRRLHVRLGGVYGSGPSTSADGADDRAPGTNGHRPSRWTPRAIARRALSFASPRFGDFPDPFRGWIDDAVRVGVDAVRRHGIDAILSLCPPASAHVVASEIARQTGLPWVPQFDDLYSFHLERQRRPEWRRYSDRAHRRWMRQATLAGAITPAMLDYVRRTYGVDGDVVMVGFDPNEVPAPATTRDRNRLRLAYTGSVYPGDQRPEIFFEALDRVVRQNDGDPPPIEAVFAGTGRDAELQHLLRSFPDAARACVFVDRLPPADALRLQRDADGLLLLHCTAPSADEGTLSFPAKTFEYLNAARPILAIPSDPGGWGDRLIESTNAGVTAHSAADAAAVISRWLDEWRVTRTLPYDGRRDRIAQFGQPQQAAALGRLLDRSVELARTH